MKIICDDKIPFLKGALEPFAEVTYLPGRETTPESVRDADALITRTRTICSPELLKDSGVKVIATATIGYDHIDTAWCESRGIIWKNAPGCNSSSVSQYIASAIVSLARKHSLRLEGMTLGVVGVGNVGSKVARTGRVLGMNVLLCDPPRARREGPEGFSDIDEIIRKSDIITLHVPLSRDGEDRTWHLFDEERIGMLRQDQILINSSRGAVVDNSALRSALQAGSIRAAVLDVWENEPAIDETLMSLLDYSTPHIAGYSADGKANGTEMSVRTVAEVLDLPLKDWSVEKIPGPVQSLEFVLDASGKSRQEILTEAILWTYDIEEDSFMLRSSPQTFEKQRGAYPVRREPTAFTVYLQHASPSMAEALRQLGFKVIH